MKIKIYYLILIGKAQEKLEENIKKKIIDIFILPPSKELKKG